MIPLVEEADRRKLFFSDNETQFVGVEILSKKFNSKEFNRIRYIYPIILGDWVFTKEWSNWQNKWSDDPDDLTLNIPSVFLLILKDIRMSDLDAVEVIMTLPPMSEI